MSPSNDKPRFTDWLTEHEQWGEITDGIGKKRWPDGHISFHKARNISKYNRYISWLWEVPLGIITTTLLTLAILLALVCTILVGSVLFVITITAILSAYALDETMAGIKKIWK
jgi:hypothetical protein